MSKNWHFPKGLTHGFGPTMAIFQTFFFRQYRLGNVFYGILDRKNAFLGYVNKWFKKSKNWNFSKGVNPWFLCKYGYSANLFFNIGYENVLYDILERKKGFLGYKNKKFKKSKNWQFSKKVIPWFWAKYGHFSNLFFSAI